MIETAISITATLLPTPRSGSPVSRGFGITEEPFAANPRVAVPRGRV